MERRGTKEKGRTKQEDEGRRPTSGGEIGFPARPQDEHAWLEKLLGEWEAEGEADMGPGEPPARTKGRETVRSLGGLWYILEGESEMPHGGMGRSVMTLGFDAAKGRYVGSWIGDMMTNQWVYEGEVDESGKVLTLNTEGPAMSGAGGTARYRDVIEIRSDDHRVLTSHVQGDDGKWKQFVEVHYRRKT